jgi:lysophospholipase L1-like esterase
MANTTVYPFGTGGSIPDNIGINVGDYNEFDFGVADGDGNFIFGCKNGHIQTKNFDSENIDAATYSIQKFAGKKIAIIGDSISTYSGWLPSDISGYDGTTYETYYPHGNVDTVAETWWYIVAQTLGIDVNNINNCSWSGSKVTGNSSATTSAKAGCSDRRITDLAARGFNPDIVLVFISCNDWTTEVPIGSWSVDSALPADGTLSTLREAYAKMLSKIHIAYPNARIFCCTNLDDYRRDETSGWPSNNGDGVSTYTWNKNIVEVAQALGCDVIETHQCGLNYSNIASNAVDEGLHPNANGMKMIAKKVIAELIAKY